LVGLHDDYMQDGRVLVEGLRSRATPHALRVHDGTVRRLGSAYEQLNASFGEFALNTLTASTHAVTAGDDSRYDRIENRIERLTRRRDRLAGRIKAELQDAAFAGRPLAERRAQRQIRRAHRIIDAAARLAGS